jgi:hypothetical protein
MAKKRQLPDFSQFFAAFRNESDRAAALLGAAYVEAALERLFRARLAVDASDDLFTHRGPLGDFAGKINLAYSLGWIPESLKHDLHLASSVCFRGRPRAPRCSSREKGSRHLSAIQNSSRSIVILVVPFPFCAA